MALWDRRQQQGIEQNVANEKSASAEDETKASTEQWDVQSDAQRLAMSNVLFPRLWSSSVRETSTAPVRGLMVVTLHSVSSMLVGAHGVEIRMVLLEADRSTSLRQR